MQGSLFDDIPELRFCGNLFVKSRNIAKKRMPRPLLGESLEEYNQNLKDEMKLEFCQQLRLLADLLEKNTLKKQKEIIDYLYKGKYDGTEP